MKVSLDLLVVSLIAARAMQYDVRAEKLLTGGKGEVELGQCSYFSSSAS